MKLTQELRKDYQSLFDTCQISPDKQMEVDKLVTGIISNQPRYKGVGSPLGVPWFVIGVIHSLEAALNFTKHLHNGDPLTARTVQKPAGRPIAGTPPYTWEASASDALTVEKYDSWTDWTVPGILYKWESYNGWGYRNYHPEVKSPYLWGNTNHYTRGKYVADGTWSSTAFTKQLGAAALLRRLAERGFMQADSIATEPKLLAALGKKGGAFTYEPTAVQAAGAELQKFLNRFPGIFLREDGRLGQLTSDAYKRVFGHYLLGDPRDK